MVYPPASVDGTLVPRTRHRVASLGMTSIMTFRIESPVSVHAMLDPPLTHLQYCIHGLGTSEQQEDLDLATSSPNLCRV